MKPYGIAIICIIIGILVVIFIRHQSVKPATALKNKTIIAFGDSLVYGYGASKGKDFVSVLGGKLGTSITNMGVSGDTTAQALARVNSVIARDPGVVIILIGGNDILRRVPIETTRSNIAQILEQFRKNGTTVVLVGVRGAILNDPYAPVYEALSKEYGTYYVPDILGGLIGNNAYMSDAIHPNDAGYARIAERLQKVLEPILK